MTRKLVTTGLILATIVITSTVLAQANTGAITGTVTEGPRPQAGIEVVLTDKDGKVQSKTRTDAKGAFEFKELAAGAYKVTSTKPSSMRKGSADANVAAGKTVVVTISLLLQ